MAAVNMTKLKKEKIFFAAIFYLCANTQFILIFYTNKNETFGMETVLLLLKGVVHLHGNCICTLGALQNCVSIFSH